MCKMGSTLLLCRLVVRLKQGTAQKALCAMPVSSQALIKPFQRHSASLTVSVTAYSYPDDRWEVLIKCGADLHPQGVAE